MDYSATAMRELAKRKTKENYEFFLKVILEELIYPAAREGKHYCIIDGEWWQKHSDFIIVDKLKRMGYKLSASATNSVITISWKEESNDKEIHSSLNKSL